MLQFIRFLVRSLTVIFILGAAAAGSYWLIFHSPEAERGHSEPPTALVEVVEARRGVHPVVIETHGTVMAAQSIDVIPQVGGKLIEISPKLVPGGRFTEGETILRIEPDDFEYVIEQREAAVEQARLALLEEQGRSTIAEREWELLGGEVPQDDAGRELALRTPHLKNAEAALAAAQSALEDARLDLRRTTIKAPFNAFVEAEFADLGQIVNPQTRVATLIGTDEAWVDARVRAEDLPWVRIPDRDGAASPVNIVYRTERFRAMWKGEVMKLQGSLTQAGRLVKLLISVDDPLRIETEDEEPVPLLIDTYVNVEIIGRPAENVFAIPETAIRQDDEGQTNIWLMDSNDRLAIRPVSILRRQRDAVLLRDGLEEGDRVVTSRLGTPLPGMKLRTSEMQLESVVQGDAQPASEETAP